MLSLFRRRIHRILESSSLTVPMVLAGLILLVLGAQGCKTTTAGKIENGDSTSTRNPVSAVLRFPIDEDPRSIEPGMSIMLQDYLIALNLHVGLFKYDSYSVLRPYLVSDWKVSPDGRTYTFFLRDDFKWHSGLPVTAGDIKAGWERHLDPNLNAWAANYLSAIAGAREMLDRKATTLTGVEAVDPHTLKVTLTHPDPRFLLELGTTPTWVAPPDATIRGESKWRKDPEGGGPFRFVQWQSHSKIVLEANPAAAGQKPFLKEIDFLIVPDAATALNMYRSDQLDVVPVAVGALPGILKDPVLSHELHFWPAAQLVFMGLNSKKIPAFKDVTVRRAFLHAIDRQAICDEVLFGVWSPASEFIPEGMLGHDNRLRLTYDPELARKLMADAGFPNGRGFPAITLATVNATQATASAAVAAQLERNLGVKVDVQRYEPSDFYQGLLSRRWDAFLTGWNADYMSPDQWLYRLLYSRAPTNYVGYSNPRLDAVVDKAIRSTNADEEAALWREANQIATEDVALVPVAFGKFEYLVKPNVAGFRVNLFGPLGFDEVRKGNPRE